MGIILRSRHQELIEKEKLSLFHVNREIKRGKKSSVQSLSKIVNNERITVTDRNEIESMSVKFFTQLFQGHHCSDGTISNSPFEPDLSKLDDFLKDLGKLPEAEKMTW